MSVNELKTAGFPRRDEGIVPRAGSENLRWRDALLASLTTASPLALYAVDDRTGAVIHVSDRFLELFGLEGRAEEIRAGEVGHAQIMLACAALSADAGAFLRASSPPAAGAPPSGAVLEIDFADGRSLRRFTSPIGLEPGAPVGRLFVFEDVTPHRRMARLFDSSQVIMFRWRAVAGWPVEAVSRSIAQWGYEPDDLYSGRVAYSAIVHADDLDRVAREVTEWSAAGVDRFHQAYRVLTRDGKVRHIDDHTLVIRDPSGMVTHYEGTILDVTDRTELMEQLVQAQKMEAVGLLAGGIAHDFNNLLMAVNLNCEALLRTPGPRGPLTPERQRALVEDIRAAGLRATALTRRLLSFTRLKALESRPVDLDAVVTDLESMLRRLIGEDIQLETRLAGGLPAIIADPSQLEQVIVNLALNARDAMSSGGRLQISTALVPAVAGRAATVRLEVSDDGKGMDAETQARLFEPFFTTKRPGKGTGLGLSTVRRIVDQGGGSISVVSAPGAGSRFTVDFPVPSSDAVARSSASLAAPTPYPGVTETTPPAGGATLLLVEDDDAVRRLVGDVLREGGYAVLEARRGSEALAMAARPGARIDLLVSDVVMPEMSGPELAARLHEARPKLLTVFLSGYADDTLAVHDLVGPRSVLLQKPVGKHAMLRAVREALDRRVG